ncbi:MAG: hypothetical protein ACXAC5_11455 [Promethearchaeota archaeon]
MNQNFDISNKFEERKVDNLVKGLKSQDLAPDNTFTGIGEPWNVTHWANRTDSDLDISFTNDSYDVLSIPLGNGWNGYTLNATITDLYDTRNWNNGSFNYGVDNNYQQDGNDSNYISNSFQNWTFGEYDFFDDSDMSGNYLDSTYVDSDGHDCLELRISGISDPPQSYGYDGQDRCYWTSFIQIPRGEVIDSELKFDVRDMYLMDSNDFELRISINNEQIYTIGTYTLRQLCGDSWRSFSIPQALWTNSSNIFTNPINDSLLSINFTLIFNQADGFYFTYSGYDNMEYQQLFIDNIELIVKAEPKPSQIQLKMNNLDVDDIKWGQGAIEQDNLWTVSPIQANFTSEDIGELGGYTIDLETDLTLFVRKHTPETNWETDVSSLGTDFYVSNSSSVNWECYSYFAVPTGYKENEMKLNYPSDVIITWVSEPQDPGTNRLGQCDNSTPGLLIIPVDTISATPDGFWRFEAISPNYCEELTINNNATGSWDPAYEFLSGDYINFTSKITNSSLVSGHLQQTKAQLHVRFPNGSIWTAKTQFKSPDANGDVYFDYFQIPTTQPYYEVGEYEVLITWNNSYDPYGLNETGIFSNKFTVIHKSLLTPDQINYEEIIEDELINLKVSFNDIENYNAIQSAIVYLDNFAGGREYFSEISPGYYFLEFNTTKGVTGNNTLTVYANSSLYVNNQVNLTVEIIQQTVLTAQEYPTLQVVWGENFTIHLNYTTKSWGTGISTTPTNNWIGDTSVIEGNPGEYNMTCNSSAYEVNKMHSLIINADNEGYESQLIILGIFVIERDSSFSVYVDSIEISELDQVDKSFNEVVSISLRLYDISADNFLSNEVVALISENYVENLTYTSDFWYNTSILCSPLNFSLGFNSIDISFTKDNYEINIFTFQLYLRPIEIGVETIGFEDTLEAEIGETITIQLQLFDNNTFAIIENATVTFSWKYGIGQINQTSPGTYQVIIDLPEGLRGNYKFELVIIPESSTYRTTLYSFIVIIGDPVIGGNPLPSLLLWIIIVVLVSIVSALGVLSLRSYVILPRKRKKEAELLSKTQKFKDLNNIQAIVIVHRLSGVPIYTKTYSILEKHKKELFTGFIQAITTIGEEFTETEMEEKEKFDPKKDSYAIEKIIELDFKYFYCLIADKEDIRVVFILNRISSERLKVQISNLMLALNLKLSQELENWDGSLDLFEEMVPRIIGEYFELFYKGSFTIPKKTNLFKMRKEKSLSKMEIRVLNVIQSMSKRTEESITLNSIIDLVSEDNKDLVIEALEVLIERKLIIPVNP